APHCLSGSAVMPPAAMMAAAVMHHHTHEDVQAVLLVVRERTVKRLRSIGEFFQAGGALRHSIGAGAKPGYRILVLPMLSALSPPRLPRLCHIPDGLLDRSPVFLLIWGERKPGLQRGDTRIGKGFEVRWAKMAVLRGPAFRRFILCKADGGSH